MKRWGILILVYLLLGVVTTVGVAWVLAATVDVSSRSAIKQLCGQHQIVTQPDANIVTRLKVLDGPGSSRWEVSEFGPLTDKAIVDHPPALADGHHLPTVPALREQFLSGVPGGVATYESRGWPLQALYCKLSLGQEIKEGLGRFDYSSSLALGAIVLERRWPGVFVLRAGDHKVLPIIPVPLGFTADMIIYAGVWGTATIAVAWVWRRMRAHPGHCVSCGYDLTGNTSGKCPECGAATTVAKAAS